MITHMVKDLQDTVAQRGLHLPALSTNTATANKDSIEAAFVTRDRATGRKHGLEYGEEFHYIGPDTSLDDYIARNAKPAV